MGKTYESNINSHAKNYSNVTCPRGRTENEYIELLQCVENGHDRVSDKSDHLKNKHCKVHVVGCKAIQFKLEIKVFILLTIFVAVDLDVH